MPTRLRQTDTAEVDSRQQSCLHPGCAHTRTDTPINQDRVNLIYPGDWMTRTLQFLFKTVPPHLMA